jgi:putative endonuclease
MKAKRAGKRAKRSAWTVYIVRCSDDSFYTGYTGDMEKRLAAHNSGKGAKYTASRRPVELVYTEAFEDRFEAMKREYRIKCMTRAKKEGLIGKYDAALSIP